MCQRHGHAAELSAARRSRARDRDADPARYRRRPGPPVVRSFGHFALLARWRAMSGPRTRGDQISLAPYLRAMSVSRARAGRRCRVRDEVFVLGAMRGSGGGVGSCADRRSRAGRALRGVVVNSHGWISAGGFTAGQPVVCEPGRASGATRWPEQIHWGKSDVPAVQRGVQQNHQIRDGQRSRPAGRGGMWAPVQPDTSTRAAKRRSRSIVQPQCGLGVMGRGRVRQPPPAQDTSRKEAAANAINCFS